MTEASLSHGANDPTSITLNQVAAEDLRAMEDISESAATQFQRAAPSGTAVMGALNGFNNPNVGRNLGHIQSQAQRAAYDLQHEPFIARVKVQTASGEDMVYYFGHRPNASSTNISKRTTPSGRTPRLINGRYTTHTLSQYT